eukprot:jgi/Hompol1/1777/HPOL_005727-RA
MDIPDAKETAIEAIASTKPTTTAANAFSAARGVTRHAAHAQPILPRSFSNSKSATVSVKTLLAIRIAMLVFATAF